MNEAKAQVTVIGKSEMIRVFNLYFNPSSLSYEDYETEEHKSSIFKGIRRKKWKKQDSCLM